jgi:CheY-like chemotaxis protein/signal transduction histidine kinase
MVDRSDDNFIRKWAAKEWLRSVFPFTSANWQRKKDIDTETASNNAENVRHQQSEWMASPSENVPVDFLQNWRRTLNRWHHFEGALEKEYQYSAWHDNFWPQLFAILAVLCYRTLRIISEYLEDERFVSVLIVSYALFALGMIQIVFLVIGHPRSIPEGMSRVVTKGGIMLREQAELDDMIGIPNVATGTTASDPNIAKLSAPFPMHVRIPTISARRDNDLLGGNPQMGVELLPLPSQPVQGLVRSASITSHHAGHTLNETPSSRQTDLHISTPRLRDSVNKENEVEESAANGLGSLRQRRQRSIQQTIIPMLGDLQRPNTGGGYVSEPPARFPQKYVPARWIRLLGCLYSSRADKLDWWYTSSMFSNVFMAAFVAASASTQVMAEWVTCSKPFAIDCGALKASYYPATTVLPTVIYSFFLCFVVFDVWLAWAAVLVMYGVCIGFLASAYAGTNGNSKRLIDTIQIYTLLFIGFFLSLAFARSAESFRRRNFLLLVTLQKQFQQYRVEAEARLLVEAELSRVREIEIASVTAKRVQEITLGYASHQLRNPIHSILFLSTELASRSDLPADVRSSIVDIRRATLRLQRISDDVLSHQRLLSGVVTILPEPVNVRMLVDDIVQQCVNIYGDAWTPMATIEIERIVPNNLLLDPLRFAQILTNALSNAFVASSGVAARDGEPTATESENSADAHEHNVHRDTEEIPANPSHIAVFITAMFAQKSSSHVSIADATKLVIASESEFLEKARYLPGDFAMTMDLWKGYSSFADACIQRADSGAISDPWALMCVQRMREDRLRGVDDNDFVPHLLVEIRNRGKTPVAKSICGLFNLFHAGFFPLSDEPMGSTLLKIRSTGFGLPISLLLARLMNAYIGLFERSGQSSSIPGTPLAPDEKEVIFVLLLPITEWAGALSGGENVVKEVHRRRGRYGAAISIRSTQSPSHLGPGEKSALLERIRLSAHPGTSMESDNADRTESSPAISESATESRTTSFKSMSTLPSMPAAASPTTSGPKTGPSPALEFSPVLLSSDIKEVKIGPRPTSPGLYESAAPRGQPTLVPYADRLVEPDNVQRIQGPPESVADVATAFAGVSKESIAQPPTAPTGLSVQSVDTTQAEALPRFEGARGVSPRIHPSSSGRQRMPQPSALRSRPLRILVVDDEYIIRRINLRAANQLGFSGVAVKDGRDVLNAVETAESEGIPFDIVLMDIIMKEMNGDEALRQLRRRGYNLPVIAATGNVSESDSHRYITQGFAYVLSKPFGLAELSSAIQACGLTLPAATAEPLSASPAEAPQHETPPVGAASDISLRVLERAVQSAGPSVKILRRTDLRDRDASTKDAD